jgi:hypothetical protein
MNLRRETGFPVVMDGLLLLENKFARTQIAATHNPSCHFSKL